MVSSRILNNRFYFDEQTETASDRRMVGGCFYVLIVASYGIGRFGISLPGYDF